MADKSGVGRFIIGRYRVFFHILLDDCDDGFMDFVLDEAGLDRDQSMAAGSIESNLDGSAGIADGELAFVV